MTEMYIAYPDGDKRYRICMKSDNEEIIEKFKYVCMEHLDKSLHWFHQSDYRNFQMFEFWITDLEKIADTCQNISEIMGLPIQTKV